MGSVRCESTLPPFLPLLLPLLLLPLFLLLFLLWLLRVLLLLLLFLPLLLLEWCCRHGSPALTQCSCCRGHSPTCCRRRQPVLSCCSCTLVCHNRRPALCPGGLGWCCRLLRHNPPR